VLAACVADGEREVLLPEADKESGVVLLLAEADSAEVACGVLRAALRPVADRVAGCATDIRILWLFSARACPAFTLEELAGEMDGEKEERLAPEALGAEDAAVPAKAD